MHEYEAGNCGKFPFQYGLQHKMLDECALFTFIYCCFIFQTLRKDYSFQDSVTLIDKKFSFLEKAKHVLIRIFFAGIIMEIWEIKLYNKPENIILSALINHAIPLAVSAFLLVGGAYDFVVGRVT
jgi:hypothetical protein